MKLNRINHKVESPAGSTTRTDLVSEPTVVAGPYAVRLKDNIDKFKNYDIRAIKISDWKV